MTTLTLAIVVGILFATGTYLVLRCSPIKLILGLGLLSHGVNLLLFGTSGLRHAAPPILDKRTFNSDLVDVVDPLPQALILTAIVISFGVTAFTVVLVNRRHALSKIVEPETNEVPSLQASDPFASMDHYLTGLDQDPDDYEWLEFTLADQLRRHREQEANENENASDVEHMHNHTKNPSHLSGEHHDDREST